MLSIQEVADQTRNAIQLLLERLELPLAVGPLNDDDFKLLCSGMYGELNWEACVGRLTGRENDFDLCFKIADDRYSRPSGVALTVFRADLGMLEIHMIESFIRNDENHPLYGRMCLFTFFAALTFVDAVQGDMIAIMEPDQGLRGYYGKFGFEDDPTCTYKMLCSLVTLRSKLEDADLWNL